MQKAVRFLICLVIGSSVAFGSIPRQAPVAAEKVDCCAKTKAATTARHCERHSPKSSNEDKQCCSLCSLCCALLATFGTPFLYPSVGRETFAAYISSEHLLPHRPPVPPPRA